jgi:hypothetical protein
MSYKEMDLEELLDEYFYMRRDANDFFNECSHPMSNCAAEIYDTLVNNYMEIMNEIERRTFHE